MNVRKFGKIILIPILLVILFAFAMFQGGFTSWFLFYSFLPIFIYQIGLLFYPLKKWQVTRELSRQTIEAGDAITVTLTIHRKIPFPLYYCICEEVFPETLNKHDLRQVKYEYLANAQLVERPRHQKEIIFPLFKRTFSMTYKLSQIPRGEHDFTQVNLRVGDVFGFIEKESTLKTSDHIVVYPSRRKIHLKERAQTFEQGPVTSHAFNLKNTNVVSGIRDYAPGDRFTWIDWKQTARTGEMMTKEFEQEKSTDTLIVLDSTMHKHVSNLAYEATVELSASLLDMFKKKATQVGLLTVAEEPVFFPVQDHLINSEMIQRHLATIQPKGDASFANQLNQSVARIKNQHLTIIVTTLISNELSEVLKQFRVRRKRIVLIYVQAKSMVSQTDLDMLKQLIISGADVSLMSEKDLTKEMIEVKRL